MIRGGGPRIALSFLVTGALCLPAPAALADPPASTQDNAQLARDLDRRGLDLEEHGHYLQALALFRHSLRLDPSPSVVLHVVACEEHLLHVSEEAETAVLAGGSVVAQPEEPKWDVGAPSQGPNTVTPGVVGAPAAAGATSIATSSGAYVGPRVGVLGMVSKALAYPIAYGCSIGAEAGLRFGTNGVIQVVVDHAIIVPEGTETAGLAVATATTTRAGATIGIMGGGDRVSLVAQLGGGYRYVNLTQSYPSFTHASSSTGGELIVGAGVLFPVGASLRLVPRLDLEIGNRSNGLSASNSDTVVTFVLAGYFTRDFH